MTHKHQHTRMLHCPKPTLELLHCKPALCSGLGAQTASNRLPPTQHCPGGEIRAPLQALTHPRPPCAGSCCSSSSRMQQLAFGLRLATQTTAAAAATASLLSEPRLAVRAARRRSAASMRGSVGSSTQWSNSAERNSRSSTSKECEVPAVWQWHHAQGPLPWSARM